MCGIAGRVDGTSRLTLDAQRAALGRACDAQQHRGPDATGVWMEEGVALGHTRLAVIDLREEAQQPMVSTDGRWTLVLNGEIYNYQRLRRQLAIEDQQTGDTRVLIELISRDGVVGALEQIDGMFAFGAWNRRDRELWLARDALGEKPLCYAVGSSSAAFSSTLDGLVPLLDPGARPAIDHEALAHYLTFGYVLSPKSILAGVSKVEPGHVVRISHQADGLDPVVDLRRWWTLPAAGAVGGATTSDGGAVRSDDALVREAARVLGDAVASRTVADVPVGAFLSGGVDSSLVTALMTQGGADVRTFTARVDDPAFDESARAAATARALGTSHTELELSTADLLATVPDLAGIYDEPFADSSQIPTVAISRLARDHVTVVLTGDGGDELFGGYERYRLADGLLGRLAGAPAPLRRTTGAAAALLAGTAPTSVAGRVVDRALAGISRPRVKLRKAAAALTAGNLAEAYRQAVAPWPDAVHQIAPALGLGPPPLGAEAGQPPASFQDLMALDLTTYLPGDLLTKVDRASMSTGLEARAPFLAPPVVAWAARLPSSALRRDADNKWILRRVLDRVLPGGFQPGPKMGFGVPLAGWLRGPLHQWCADHIAREDGWIDQDAAAALWQQHLSGHDRSVEVWTVVMWRAWLAQRPWVSDAP